MDESNGKTKEKVGSSKKSCKNHDKNQSYSKDFFNNCDSSYISDFVSLSPKILTPYKIFNLQLFIITIFSLQASESGLYKKKEKMSSPFKFFFQ